MTSTDILSLQGLSGHTKIPLLTGEILPLHQLVSWFNSGMRDIWILSWNAKYEVFEPDLIVNTLSVGRKQLYRIFLDNGQFVDCTANHYFFNRESKQISLHTGIVPLLTSLLPYHIREREGYFEVYNPIRNAWYKRYKIVSEAVHGKKPYRYHTHHIDFNKHNDSPENLMYLTSGEHSKIHSSVMWTQPEFQSSRDKQKESLRQYMLQSGQGKWMNQMLRENPESYKMAIEKSAQTLTKYNKSEKGRTISRERAEHMRKITSEYSPEQRRLLTLKKGLYNLKSLGYDSPEYQEAMNEIHQKEVEFCPVWKEDKGQKIEFKGIKKSLTKFKRSLRKVKARYGESSPEFLEMLTFVRENFPEYNHAVERIDVLGEKPVFDLVTEKNNSFVLEAGIVSGKV